MSQDGIKQVIGRAVVDAEFKNLLFSNSAEALKGFDLTAEEAAGISKMPSCRVRQTPQRCGDAGLQGRNTAHCRYSWGLVRNWWRRKKTVKYQKHVLCISSRRGAIPKPTLDNLV